VRKTLVIVLGALLLLPLGAMGAQAAKPDKYDNKFFDAYWNSRRKIDHDTYLKTTWYSGVYVSGDSSFWSDLYKNTELCHRLDGRDRCSQRANWYDSIDSLGSGSFTIDTRLNSGQLTATYELHDYSAHHQPLVGITAVTVDLVGVGTVTKSTQRYTYSDGCNTYRYSGRSKSRSAEASGTYQIGTDAARNFGTSDDSTMSAGTSIEVSHTC
jgi:hypothetical protein